MVSEIIALDKQFHLHIPLISELTITAALTFCSAVNHLKLTPMSEFSNVEPSMEVL